MRSRVLVRLRGSSQANKQSEEVGSIPTKRQKRAHEDKSITTSRPLGQQDNIASFELPQLEQLLQGLNQEPDDDIL